MNTLIINLILMLGLKAMKMLKEFSQHGVKNDTKLKIL